MKVTADTGVPIAEQAAMRDEVMCAKGEVNGLGRCTDSRAGGHAG